jgi:hypothetical protein
MTLILAFASADYLALASDRRITWSRNGTIVHTEDGENKALIFAGHFLVGYTGLARLGGLPTDKWVGEKLSDVEPQNYFTVLRQELQQAIADARHPAGLSGHAFVATGYGRMQTAPGELVPVGLTVSNATGGRYSQWTPRVDVSVARTSPLVGADDFRLGPAGIVPKKSDLDDAIEWIRRYRKRDKTLVAGVLQVLVRLIRQVADSDKRVGKDVSLSVMPRSAVGQGTVASHVGALIDPVTETTCIFVPSDREIEQADVYCPTIIQPGMVIWGAEAWSGRKPSWWQDET